MAGNPVSPSEHENTVGVLNKSISRLNSPACDFPCLRLQRTLTNTPPRLGADVTR